MANFGIFRPRHLLHFIIDFTYVLHGASALLVTTLGTSLWLSTHGVALLIEGSHSLKCPLLLAVEVLT
jgi:hypothetical protein